MEDENRVSNFIEKIIAEDIKNNKYKTVVTRFPPEPNGYLHIGHAKSIFLNFSLAEKFLGKCNLRFDDTNPAKEDEDYVNSIKEDVKWLGFNWEDREFYASDYFDKMYEYAVYLIKKGKAYVCNLSPEQIREYRGTLTKPGKESPYRNRSIEENLNLFKEMKSGKFKEGECVLRAKIDMASPNLNLRDPVMYRISYKTHHRLKDRWCIYPTYDWAHGIEDSIEKVTHSICTLEFEDHRPLYDWFLEQLEVFHPRQIEFARLNLTYTVLSKRKLIKLIDEGYVTGWDDPRMPTIKGLRRKGYTPESIKEFTEKIGVAKSKSVIDFALLEHCVRDDLNKKAQRVMVVENPIKLIIDNYDENRSEEIDVKNNPEDESAGVRKVTFSRYIYIEASDFMENPPKKFFRLSPGKEVRLIGAYYIKCTNIQKDSDGNITEIHCTYDPETKGGWSRDKRKVKGSLHWLSVKDAIDIEIREYENLFTKENPDDVESDEDFTQNINKNSLKIIKAKAEPILRSAKPFEHFQFLRKGYFSADKDTQNELPVFNKTVGLRDNWAKKNN